MHSRSHPCLKVLGWLFVWALSLSRPVWADDIVSITDQNGRKIFINTGETRANGRRATNLPAPAKADNAILPPPEINTLVEQTASRLQVDPQLVHAIIKVESEYDPKAVSSKGAMGLMQLIPETAQRFGVDNPFNPKENIEGGVSYLRHLLDRFGGDLPLSLAALPFTLLMRALNGGSYAFGGDMTGRVIAAGLFGSALAYLAGAIVETIVRLLAGLVARTRAPER